MRVGTFSRGICKLPNLSNLLEAESVSLLKDASEGQSVDLVVGWGRKGNTLKAQAWARKHKVPYASLEDGFIRSPGLGREGLPSLSYVVDYSGIYYDATTASDLEKALESANFSVSEDEHFRARQLIKRLIGSKISKYSGAPDYDARHLESERQRVLVVDQVRTDASVYFGRASDFSLEKAVDTARQENPLAEIIVKLHPETVHGIRKGFYTKSLFKSNAVKIIDYDVNPISLLESIDHVYVGTSQLGFEALLLGKKVTCFGLPFYAGWGLTDDRKVCSRRTRQRSVEDIFIAAYLRYTRYINPVSGSACSLEDALDILERQRPLESSSKVFCYGIRHWKRYNILPYLPAIRKNIHFVGTSAQARQLHLCEGDNVIVWGNRKGDDLDSVLKHANTPLMRMEDGFLRSVGLGSDFHRPSSLVIDKAGIYFDPDQPSDLENLINVGQFDDQQLEAAKRLRHKLLSSRVSKYNGQTDQEIDIAAADGKRIILIPGQVADDASIKAGCKVISDNATLIRDVRKKNPDAYLIYKPHPDVLSGNRKGKVAREVTDSYVDLVVEHIGIAACLDIADEVHTMTSLVGFEALLREIPVTCYGLPFYAGWGLTSDELTLERRRKNVTLDQLVTASLIQYPMYYDWDSGYFGTCEEILDKLVAERDDYLQKDLTWQQWLNFLIKRLRQVQLIIKGVTYAR